MELEGEKNKALDHVSKLESEEVKSNAKFLFLKEQIGELPFDKEYVRAALVAAGVHHDKLSDELTLQ